MWDIMGNICERAQGNLWSLYRKYLWEIFMWANEIRARKFVPQHTFIDVIVLMYCMLGTNIFPLYVFQKLHVCHSLHICQSQAITYC